jgi:hypothetical protein
MLGSRPGRADGDSASRDLKKPIGVAQWETKIVKSVSRRWKKSWGIRGDGGTRPVRIHLERLKEWGKEIFLKARISDLGCQSPVAKWAALEGGISNAENGS